MEQRYYKCAQCHEIIGPFPDDASQVFAWLLGERATKEGPGSTLHFCSANCLNLWSLKLLNEEEKP